MSDHSASLFVGEDEDVPSRHRAVLEEDSSDSDWELENLKHGNSTLSSPEESDQNDEGKGPLYCVCRRPERGAMLGCDGDCEDWFHEDCLDISKNDWDNIEKFVCPSCTERGRGVTIWKDGVKREDENLVARSTSNAVEEVFGTNEVLRQSLSSNKTRVARATLPAELSRKHIARSRLRAGLTPQRQAPPPPGFSATRARQLRSKMRVSLPTFENTLLGNIRFPRTGSDDNDGGDGDVDGDEQGGDGRDDCTDNRDLKHAENTALSSIVASITRQHESMTRCKRRNYIDIEEAPTSVDKLVKNTLEEALFGRSGN